MSKTIGKNAITMTVSKFTTIIISMITTMILSRQLSLEDYGTYSQLLMIITLVSMLFSMGLPSSINYFAAKTEDNQERRLFFSNYYSISTLLSLISGLFLILCFPLIEKYFNNPDLINFAYVLAVLPWVQIITSSIGNFLIIYNQTNKLMLYQILHSVFVLLTILVARLYNLNFYVYMFLFLIVEVLFCLIVYLTVFLIAGKLYIKFNKEVIRNIFEFSIPIGLSTVVGTISVQLDKMIIARYFSVEQLAIYANASRELPLTFIASSITAVLLPNIVKKIHENKVESAIKLWGAASILSYICICFFTTFVFINAAEIIVFLYSDKFLPGKSVFQVYTLILLLRFTYFAMILSSIGKTRFILYSSIFSLILNVILSLIFYKLWGFIGPSIATLVSMFIIAFAQLKMTAVSIKHSFSNIMPWANLIKISAINAVFGIIFYFLKISLFQNIQNDLVKIMVLFIVWFLMYLIIIKKDILNSWKLLK